VHFTDYHTRLAAYGLIIDQADRVLLTWYNGLHPGTSPCWTMPGGGVEFDESLREAVVREVFEETGYAVEVGGVLAEHHLVFPAADGRKPVRSQRFVMSATIISGELGTTELSGTTDFARWVPIDEARVLQPSADIVRIALDQAGATGTPYGTTLR